MVSRQFLLEEVTPLRHASDPRSAHSAPGGPAVFCDPWRASRGGTGVAK